MDDILNICVKVCGEEWEKIFVLYHTRSPLLKLLFSACISFLEFGVTS